MWEFVADMGFEFYEPQFVSDKLVGDESCMYSAEEDVGSTGDPPLKLSFVGFRQGSALVVVGVFSLSDNFDFQTPVVLARAQSNLLAGASTSRPAPGSGPLGQPTPEDAIGAYLYSYDIEYIGDCDYADPAADVGRYCSKAFDDRGDSVIYLAGPTFSEFDSWLLTEQYEDGSWGVADATDLTYDISGDPVLPAW